MRLLFWTFLVIARRIIIIVIFGLTLSIKGDHFIGVPSDTAGLIGGWSQLNCSATLTTDYLEWMEFLDGSGTGGNRIFSTVDGIVMDPRFDVIKDSAQGVYDLVLLDVQPTLGGLYICSLMLSDQNAPAEFISIVPVMCSPTAGDLVVREGDDVSLICDVTYHGNRSPRLAWYTHMGGTLSGHLSTDATTITYTTNITVSIFDHMQDFICALEFQSSDSDVRPPPTYTDSCTTHFNVLHAVTDMYVEPPADDLGIINRLVDETINCSAAGFPEPRFYWTDVTGTLIQDGWMLTMTPDMADGTVHACTCVAENDVDSVYYNLSMTVQVLVGSLSTELPGNQGGTEPWVVAVAIAVPAILAIVAIVVGFILYKRRKNKRKASDEGTEGETNRPPSNLQHEGTTDPSPGVYPYNVSPMPPNMEQTTRLTSSSTPSNYPTPVLYSGIPNGKPAPYGATNAAYRPPPTPPPQPPQQGGRESPGYGDLGIRHFGTPSSASNPQVSLNPQGDASSNYPPTSSQARVSSISYDNSTFDRTSTSSFVGSPTTV